MVLQASQTCRGCPLYCNATQAVFGEGARDAFVMFVGEQPGDQEDLAGHPFVGPAGRLLDEVLDRVKVAVETVLTKGVGAAMNEFNRKPEEPSSEGPTEK